MCGDITNDYQKPGHTAHGDDHEAAQRQKIIRWAECDFTERFIGEGTEFRTKLLGEPTQQIQRVPNEQGKGDGDECIEQQPMILYGERK